MAKNKTVKFNPSVPPPQTVAVYRPQPVIIKRQVKKPKKTFDSDLFNSIYLCTINALKKPPVLISILVIIALIYSHEFDSKNSHLSKLISKITANESLKPFGDWINDNLKKFYGLLMLIPLYFEIPNKHRILILCGLAAFIVLSNPLHYYYYLIISVSLFLYFKLNTNSHKLVIILLLCVTFFLQNDTVVNTVSSTTTRTNTT